MSESKERKYKTEWSFSFEKVNENISKFVGSIKVGDAELKKEQVSAALDGATSASVRLDLSVGEAHVRALEGSDNLIEADLAYIGEIDFTVSGEVEKKVRLGQRKWDGVLTGPIKDALGAFSNRDDLRWDVRLTPAIPLDLSVHCGVGAANLDLSALNVTALNVDGGVGEAILHLPAPTAHYNADIDSGVGNLRLVVNQNAALHMDIDGGVGGVHIQIPAEAAVRIQAESGLGGIKLPSHFVRTKGGDDFITTSGVWETPDFSSAPRQITIRYKGGVGGLKIS